MALRILPVVGCLLVVASIQLTNEAEDQSKRDGPWTLSMGDKCIVSQGADKPVKQDDVDSENCTHWFGHDQRGGRVSFRYGGQESKWVLHYDPDKELWITAAEDGSGFEKKQLFEAKPGAAGFWCLVYDDSMCLKIALNKWTTTTTTTTTTVTTTTSTTTTSTSTTVTTTTTTSTTTTIIPPLWIKSEKGDDCMTACGGSSRCMRQGFAMVKDEASFKQVLEWVGDDTCTKIDEGDWEYWPGQYSDNSCYFSAVEDRDPEKCANKHYNVRRYCPCDPDRPPPTVTKPPKPSPTSPPSPSKPTKPSRRRGKGAVRRRGKGAKPTPAPTTEAPTPAPTTEAPTTRRRTPKRRRRGPKPTRRRSGKGGKGGKPTTAKPTPPTAKPTTPMPTTAYPEPTPAPTARRRNRRRAAPVGAQWQCGVCGYGPISDAEYKNLVTCPQCGQPKSVYRKVSFVEAVEAKVSQTTLLTNDGFAVHDVDPLNL